ncbi:DNA-processing protein DprA [Nocardia asteroides]|uniref:DNA-processing protein DprA n=1 Tax=Nocardia asteroides TaxID=1824 RepID=UPI003790CE85
MADAHTESVALLALLNARPYGWGWTQIAAEVALRSSACALWDEWTSATTAQQHQIDDAAIQLAEWSAADFDLVTILDPHYPGTLREIHQMPPMLFIRGRIEPDLTAVSIVGSRGATADGLALASQLAHGLARRDIAVLSGLALGIDTAAHSATLAVGGVPIGVIGTGINRVYPAANRQLHADVAAAGALVSQFWPDASPSRQSFPMRNTTMSGLGMASIIIEASEKSGSRIQARVAGEHGRAVILTDRVVEQTTWGKEIQHRPGVFVGSTADDILSIVDDVTAARHHRGLVRPSLERLEQEWHSLRRQMC